MRYGSDKTCEEKASENPLNGGMDVSPYFLYTLRNVFNPTKKLIVMNIWMISSSAGDCEGTGISRSYVSPLKKERL